MEALKTLKLRGLTAAQATINTIDIVIHDDGMVRYTDLSGNKRAFPLQGDAGLLIRDALQGSGGYAAADYTPDRPKLSGPGVGGRTDP